MKEVYLLLGSNEGKREDNLIKALTLIEQRCGKVINKSQLYETEAWGLKEQNSFLNQAVEIETTMPPKQLLNALKNIETETGRVATVKWGPRLIDIDILFYGNQVIDEPELKVPHPFIQDRRFTLIPLNEIAPQFIHPVIKVSMSELLSACKDESVVKLYE